MPVCEQVVVFKKVILRISSPKTSGERRKNVHIKKRTRMVSGSWGKEKKMFKLNFYFESLKRW